MTAGPSFVAHATDALRRAGCPVTPQRLAVLELLEGNAAHPSAAEVCAALDDASRATVYKTLALLVRLGVCDAVTSPTGELRFDPRLDPHHHFFCTSCGGLFDLPVGAVQVHVPSGFAPARSRVLVEGCCAGCGQTAPATG